MIDNTAASENQAVPAHVLSSPALLFLYYRIEQALGIKAGSGALEKLNEYIEKDCGSAFIENPAAFEHLFSSNEQIYVISKFLTVNETYFFREGVHFETLSGLLPELAKLNRPIQICSAAVSIGCEAYSIAMLLDYHAKKGLDFDFAVDAFDVSAEAIETAKNARYTANTLRTDGTAWKYILDSYLIPDNGEYLVSQNIRRKVNFFTHNIMSAIDRQYDVIFFRNSLIYFSSRNRLSVINNLAESLFINGVLFLGVSETASIKHPLLAERYSSNVFYFQKMGTSGLNALPELKQNGVLPGGKIHIARASKHIRQKNSQVSRENIRHSAEISVNCAEIADILRKEDEKPSAKNVLDMLENGTSNSLSGSIIAASAIYYLHAQDFKKANKVLTFLEKNNSGAFTRFLRGEYCFLTGNGEEAEKFYQEAAIKNKFFWPAFYRIAVLASEGNRTRYEYKIKKTIESIGLSQNRGHGEEFNYECFMGGFSPDYFLRILEKKLTDQ
jgi:chemotaxis protein methyltransferase CheR